MTEKGYFLWVDTIKAFAIFLVVLGHSFYPEQGLSYDLKSFIYSFHMPVFFFLSGFLFKPCNSLKEHLKKYTRSLLFPYLSLNVISCLIYVIFLNRHQLFLLESSKEFLIGGGHSFAGPTWFLLCLFWTCLFFYLVQQKNKLLILLSIPVSILIAYFIPKGLYWSIGATFMAYPFFSVGNLIKNKMKELSYSKTFSIIGSILCFLSVVLLSKIQGKTDLFSLNFGTDTQLLYYPTAFLGIAMCYFIAINFSNKKNKFISAISRSTLIIMGIHPVFLSLTDYIIFKSGLSLPYEWLLKSIFVFFVVTLIADTILKRCPSIVGK